MHSSALRKQPAQKQARAKAEPVQAQVLEMSDEEAYARIWNAYCAKIAAIAEAACNLPGNTESPDFEAFEAAYGIGQSEFA